MYYLNKCQSNTRDQSQRLYGFMLSLATMNKGIRSYQELPEDIGALHLYFMAYTSMPISPSILHCRNASIP